jgi:hypothetical protein
MICLGTMAKCNLIKYISHVIIIIIISHDISYLGWLVMFGVGSLEPADDYATSTVSRWENMNCKWWFFSTSMPSMQTFTGWKMGHVVP